MGKRYGLLRSYSRCKLYGKRLSPSRARVHYPFSCERGVFRRYNRLVLCPLLELGDHDHAFFGDGEALAVVCGIVTDDGVGENDDPFIDDGPSNTGPFADSDVFHNDGIADFGMRFDPNVW